MGKTTNETPLVVRHDLMEVVLQKLHLEISQVETTIVICSKLIGTIQNYLISIASSHESVRHSFSNFKYLII